MLAWWSGKASLRKKWWNRDVKDSRSYRWGEWFCFSGDEVLVPGRGNRRCKDSKNTQLCSELTESQCGGAQLAKGKRMRNVRPHRWLEGTWILVKMSWETLEGYLGEMKILGWRGMKVEAGKPIRRLLQRSRWKMMGVLQRWRRIWDTCLKYKLY